MSNRARQITMSLVAAAFALSLVAPSANAAQLSFSAQRISGAKAVFSVAGLAPAEVKQANLRVGDYGMRIPTGRVRAGRLLLPLPARVAQRLRRGNVSRASARRRWPKLTVVTEKASKPSTEARPAAEAPTVTEAPTAAEAQPAAETSPAVESAPSRPSTPVRPTAPASPSVPRGVAVEESVMGFEGGGFSEASSLQAKLGGALSVTGERAYEGQKSARASWTNNLGSAAQRVWKDVKWNTGSEVWYGMALYVPNSTNYGWWQPIRWDNYDVYGGTDDDQPGYGDVGGVNIEDNQLSITKGDYADNEDRVLDAGPMPKGRWVWLEVHQIFSGQDGQALSELYVDGQKRGSSTKANTNGREITDLRAGAVSIDRNNASLGSIDFDRITISNTQRGPLH